MDKTTWNNTLVEEAKTWNIEDPAARAEKIERERIRYPKLIKDLNLHLLSLEDKVVVEIGSGPIAVLSCLKAKEKIAIDPLIPEYKKFNKLAKDISWLETCGEQHTLGFNDADAVLIINALDHTQDPDCVIKEVVRILKPSGYLGIITCIDNAVHNPHPAHVHNIDERILHSWVDKTFETVHELTYKKDAYVYGWRNYKGKVGTPAIAWLGRKVTGYDKENTSTTRATFPTTSVKSTPTGLGLEEQTIVCSKCGTFIAKGDKGDLDIFKEDWPCPVCKMDWRSQDAWHILGCLKIPTRRVK